MCVLKGVMVDSGTIQFIASQEMAHEEGERGRAAGSAPSPSPGDHNSIVPGPTVVHTVQAAAHGQCTLF